MKKLSLLCVIVLLVAAGCTKPFEANPTETGYQISTVYGGLDGSKEDAQKFLDKRAAWVCPDGYKKISEKRD